MESNEVKSDVEGTERVYRIGELAELTGSTTRTLRFYEEMNLLKPVRNSSGQRLYSGATIDRLNFIGELKTGGFSLQDIKNFFDLWENVEKGGDAADASMKLIQNKLVEISELQSRINKLNTELKGMVSYLLSCKGCEHKPSFDGCGQCDQHSHHTPDPLLMTILKKH